MSATALRYSKRVLELFMQLPGSGSLPEAAGEHVSGEAMALDRGAWVRFEVRLEQGRIADCRFRAWGCPHTLAAAALVTAELRTRSREDMEALDGPQLARMLDAPAEKMGRLLVVEDALRSLLACLPRLQ